MCFGAIVLLFSALSCICQQNTLLDRIKLNYSGKTEISTSFDVHIAWKVRETEETRHGSIALAPGDRFRVELGTGVWVSNGNILWQFDRVISQVVIKQLSAADPAMLPSSAVTRYCSDYPLAALQQSGPDAVFEWKADTSAAARPGQVSFVRLIADKKSAVIKKLIVVDKIGNESSYIFSRTVLGKKMPSSTFEFEPPKGARVLDQR
jgi:outer membrane lipoprotein-sorting protein